MVKKICNIYNCSIFFIINKFFSVKQYTQNITLKKSHKHKFEKMNLHLIKKL